jgi:hypothetical protein
MDKTKPYEIAKQTRTGVTHPLLLIEVPDLMIRI